MTTLLLRLAGPIQSWGSSSRFVRRTTDHQPTKSGVMGLLAAALGRRRTDSIEDLLGLRFGVRLDQPGRIIRDFQTARTLDGAASMPLSYRYYLSDAAFLAAVEADRSLLETLDQALRFPSFPLYLGRRSCPPAGPVTLGLRDGGVVDVLCTEPWTAAAWWQRRSRDHAKVQLDTVVDGDLGAGRDGTAEDAVTETFQDAPISFDPRRRMYGLRSVVRFSVSVDNPEHVPRRPVFAGEHDPLAAVGGD